MKKGIVFGLLALAIIVLVSPGVLGKMAESYVEQSNEWTATGLSGSGMAYESVSYEGGWFVSESVDRLSFTDMPDTAELAEALGLDDASQLPTFVISTRLDHGLIPVSSLSRDGGSLAPALARTVSTVSLESPGGGSVEIPSDIHGYIGLNGTVHSEIEIEAGSKTFEEMVASVRDSADALGLKGDFMDELNSPEATANDKNIVLSWQDIAVATAIEPGGGRVTVEGGGDGWSMEADDGSVRVGAFTLSSDQTPNDFGIGIGNFAFAIDTVEVQQAAAPGGTFGPITMEGSTTSSGERVSGDTQVYVAAQEFPGVGSASMSMDVSVTDIDAESLKSLTDKLNTMDDDLPQEAMFAMLEPDLKTVLSSGLTLDFKQLDIELPQGAINSAISLSLPETDAAAFSWAGVMQAMSGRANLSVAEPLVDFALMMNPQAQMVVGMGFLKKNGEVYEMEALYEKGLLTVNGAPIPLPMP